MCNSAFPMLITEKATAIETSRLAPANAHGDIARRVAVTAQRPSSHGQNVNNGGNGRGRRRARIRFAVGFYQARKSVLASSAT